MEVKTLIVIVDGGERNGFDLGYRTESHEVQSRMCRDKRKFMIALVREAYRITKQLAVRSKSFHGYAKDVDGSFFIHENEWLNKWEVFFTTVLKRTTSDEVSFLVDKMNRSKIIFAINRFKRSEASGVAVVIELLLKIIH